MKITLGELKTGAAGTAQELIGAREVDDPPDWLSTIGQWFITAPRQSPAWQHYVLGAIHLRPIEGVKPAHVGEPGATHEFLLFALDPEANPEPTNYLSWKFLSPFNVVEQVALADDSAASRLLSACAQCVVDGKLWAEPPLSGQREPWRSFLRSHGSARAPD